MKCFLKKFKFINRKYYDMKSFKKQAYNNIQKPFD